MPGHLKVNCPEGAREATLGCPHLADAKQGRQILTAYFFKNDY